jgi:exopolyphosphatase/guanosine-5'-triphosphate,3'-diphosphate pyrophosphatase
MLACLICCESTFVTDCVAALDCGSNSTRLLIVDAKNETVFRDSRITRLSQGVDATMTLTQEAMARSFDVLSDYRTMMDEAGVSRGLLVATSAVRDASNGDDFVDEARRRTGVDAKILSGHEEAAYSYAGATTGLPADDRATAIVDVGGGSTELAVMVDGVLESYSMQLGCVRVTERALGKGVVTARSRDAATAMIGEQLDKAWEAVPAFATLGDVRLIGLAGSVSTLVQLDARMETYDRELVHLQRISLATVREWRDRLASEPPQARLARPGMIRGREDVLPAGLYVLAAVMERLGVDELLSSESDILDGITSSLLS